MHGHETFIFTYSNTFCCVDRAPATLGKPGVKSVVQKQEFLQALLVVLASSFFRIPNTFRKPVTASFVAASCHHKTLIEEV